MLEIRSKVGSRGQIVIPKPIRDMFQIHSGERMSFRVENNEILMRKEDGAKILRRIFNRFEDKEPEPSKIDWDELYYSQFDTQ
ncbi:MAG: AbrB/MazE/SpoVT family DNA-binding domain-containing protein [Candidatus Undinarchaeales archaeon]|jgi:AbrB family looped-hinge helix DNA binding protein|nr:AbrB/MazE/SpoVT family DNA-binding domain-containing protein [Candidatus Undinarchaeales archaeon]